MKLSVLIYNTIASVSLQENRGIISPLIIKKYANILTSNTNEDIELDVDYRVLVDNAFLFVNEAIQRLSNLDKLPPKIVERDIENGLIDLTEVEDLDRVLNVYTYKNKEIINYGFNEIDHKKLLVLDKVNSKVFIEYYPDIRLFDMSDISYYEDPTTHETTDNDIELKDFGITNKMANYISIYARGKLGYDIYGSEANQYVNQAEAYFNDLDSFGGRTLHFQNHIDSKYKVL